MTKIKITENHIFLNNFDIAPFVDRKSIKIDGNRVTVTLLVEVEEQKKSEVKLKGKGEK